MKLKTLAVEERPREKLILQGVETLSNAELMAIVLQSGSKRESAISLSQNILSVLDHGIQDLSTIAIEELLKVHGIGKAKACQLTAAVELGKRVTLNQRQIYGKISSPSTVVDYFQSKMRHLTREEFIVVFLNTKNIITSYETISIGSLSASIVHPREVFNRAIKRSAASLILLHNHPSGNPNPSRDDEIITKRLCEVGEVVGIKILDHLIICDEAYFSFKESLLI